MTFTTEKIRVLKELNCSKATGDKETNKEKGQSQKVVSAMMTIKPSCDREQSHWAIRKGFDGDKCVS